MIQDISPHVLRNEFVPDVPVTADGLLFAFGEGGLLCSLRDGVVRLPRVGEISPAAEVRYLFALDGAPCFLGRLPEGALPDGWSCVPVRELRRRVEGPREIIFAAWTAFQMFNWYRDNRFCGRCGGETVHAPDERALCCPNCKRRVYPRINPAVIVGVTHGDEIVMTKYRGRDIPYYALVAGFVEIGETLEQTVAREVMEETGLRVKHIRYYKSQPWAIVDDLLAGFYCDVEGSTDIRMDEGELKEALWVRRQDVVGQPNDFSLTNEMMLTFRDGREPR